MSKPSAAQTRLLALMKTRMDVAVQDELKKVGGVKDTPTTPFHKQQETSSGSSSGSERRSDSESGDGEESGGGE